MSSAPEASPALVAVTAPAGRTLEVRLGGGRVTVACGGRVIARHERSARKGAQVLVLDRVALDGDLRRYGLPVIAAEWVDSVAVARCAVPPVGDVRCRRAHAGWGAPLRVRGP